MQFDDRVGDRVDDELNGDGFLQISNVFATQNEFSVETAPVDRGFFALTWAPPKY